MPRLLVVFARQLEILVTTLDTLIVTPLIPPPPKKNRLIAGYNPYDGLFGEFPPKRGTFSRLQVAYEKIGKI